MTILHNSNYQILENGIRKIIKVHYRLTIKKIIFCTLAYCLALNNKIY